MKNLPDHYFHSLDTDYTASADRSYCFDVQFYFLDIGYSNEEYGLLHQDCLFYAFFVMVAGV